MGDGSGEVRVASSRSNIVRNSRNHRIAASDLIGLGAQKQKFRQNIEAIKVLHRVETEGREATAEEKAILVRYVGWGGLPQVFASPPPSGWHEQSDQLLKLLSEDELRSARASTLNAHYTSPEIIQAMYAGLERLGFTGGKVLEPACGLGHFIGLMPDGMHQRSSLTAVELDSLTARIAQRLYPDADIRHSPYESAQLVDGSFDLAISNVPFGDYRPYDKRFNAQKFPIHDYFFAASLERVRPGGLIVFITSRGTLDKKSPLLRKHLAKQADLVAAVRLPNTAFLRNANTDVTTDIVILQKRIIGQAASKIAWEQSIPFSNEQGEEMRINEYFVTRPQQMLGRMELKATAYRSDEPALVSDGRDLPSALRQAFEFLPKGIYQALQLRTSAPVEVLTVPASDDIKPNAFSLIETDQGTMIGVRVGAKIVARLNLPGDTTRRIRGLIKVRAAVKECLRTQVADLSELEIRTARMRLNSEYDQFYSRFGPISERGNTRAFAGDPDLPLLLSLENFNDETRVATKTAIFRERTIQYQKPAESAGTAREALLISLNENGRVDLSHMSGLLNRPAEEFLPELRGTVFLNPANEKWETDDAYLSGNIREKLTAAEAATAIDARFRENVEALRSVLPEPLKATEIDARLGSVWIPESDVERFVQELLNLPSPESVRIRHVPLLGTWAMQAHYSAKSSVGNTTEWGTPRYSAVELIEDALNLRTPTIYDFDPKNDQRRLNPSATEAAREKQYQIKERFTQWIWQDDERRERLLAKYNHEFNNIRVRTFDGTHLSLPGASPIISLRPHQKAAVWRILQTPNTLLAHVVGAGKTYTMVAAGMEAKRLGLCQKPLFVVPNHMLGQFSSELLTLYPNANILVAGKDDFEASRRAQLFSRIATGKWDAVIVTHSGFERIPVSRDAQESLLKEQIEEMQQAIREQQGDKSFTRLVKQLEAAKNRLETRLKILSAEDKKDNTLTFEELGIDRLFVDEAHYFKNLFYVTKMTRVAGLPQTSSQRAFDMFLKVRHLQNLNGTGGVIFATGTPVTNTMAEMFTMQRYLQRDDLEQHGLQHFDSWAATFGEPVTAMELSPDGAGYRLNTRFARFVNVPELMQQFRQMADIQTAETLQLPVPKLANGKATTVVAPSTPQLKAFVASLVKRAERLRTQRVDPSVDNMLKVTGDGRKAALDLRLVLAGRDHPDNKLSHAARTVFEIWNQTKEKRLTQIVFCDLSTPQDGSSKAFSAYDDLKTKLVRQGIPEDEIAFIQDYTSDAAKASLFKNVRSGRIRVLMGSTQMMGTGTNVQERLIALHHLDAPWRPADIEQREGRILRQGNTNAEVKIFRYVTEGSFDAYMWGILETKARFIGQIMTKESHVRRIEDLDAPALTYAEVKAIASGNPLVIEKARVDAELMRLQRLQSQHREALYLTRHAIRCAQNDIPRLEQTILNIQADTAARINTRGEAFAIQIGNQYYRGREAAGTALNHLAQKHLLDTKPVEVGTFAGFRIRLSPDGAKEVLVQGANSYAAKIGETPLGTISSLEYAVRSLDERLTDCQQQLAGTRRRLEELRPHADKPFEHQTKLDELAQRQQEIMSALDLTKNQASSTLSADEAPAMAEVAEESVATAPAVKRAVSLSA